MNIAENSGPTGPVQEVNLAADWAPDSWQNYSAIQQVNYPDQDAVD